MEITKNALPFGLHEKTSEGLSAKRSYASPTIKVVSFKVEEGFQSPLKVGNTESTPQQLGAEELQVRAWYE